MSDSNHPLCTMYVDGRPEPVVGGIAEALAALRDSEPGVFAWLDLGDAHRDELLLAAQELHLPRLAVEDALRAHQRAKYETYPDCTFAVLKTLRYVEETSDVETGELMIFMTDKALVTMCHGDHDPSAEARRHLAEQPQLTAHGVMGLVYALLESAVGAYVRISAELASDLVTLERRVLAPDRRDAIADIYELKREVLEFRSAVDPLVPVAETLVRTREHSLDVMQQRFRHVADQVIRVSGEARSCDELLNSALSTQLALVGTWQNEDMRKISAWAAMAAVPTLVAGVYGMNFRHMPELRWSFGYPLVLGLMAIVCGSLYATFRRNKWL